MRKKIKCDTQKKKEINDKINKLEFYNVIFGILIFWPLFIIF